MVCDSGCESEAIENVFCAIIKKLWHDKTISKGKSYNIVHMLQGLKDLFFQRVKKYPNK